MTECPHERYRAVETCPICEAEEERDAARDAARQFFEAAAAWGSFPPGGKVIWITEMVARWPFLGEGR